jgi:hypothetical protein
LNPIRTEEAISKIKEQHPNSNLKVVIADITDLETIRRAAEELTEPIHVSS